MPYIFFVKLDVPPSSFVSFFVHQLFVIVSSTLPKKVFLVGGNSGRTVWSSVFTGKGGRLGSVCGAIVSVAPSIGKIVIYFL